ncbi:MAG: glycosyltransferase family 39 protein, partial [Actinobacteria bacterium]|nr:glycosyltransferase family 39 protein [Actinomycetota bacterium]
KRDDINKIFRLQGSKTLKPLEAVFALSFLNKIFPKNPISRKYFLYEWNKKEIKEVDVVPGTAFMISKELFLKAGGFDERFFLYFEENDFCHRIKEIGFELYMIPSAKIIHYRGMSTKKRDDINKIFAKSRFLYFRKYFGFFRTCLIEGFLRINKSNLLILFIFIFSLFLRFYKFPERMYFIGDQGWFYLSARDMIIDGKIPLVGITASHTWLHQGPFWTYILALIFSLFGFNPLFPGYFSIIIGSLTVLSVYFLTKKLFSEKTALISSLLYSASPYILKTDMAPYHTTLIPFFVSLLMFFCFKFINEKRNYLFYIFLFLGILYNFELATQVLWIPVILIILLFFIKNKNLISIFLNFKYIPFYVISVIFPLTPILIYDFGHNFNQTLKFAVWIIYTSFTFIMAPANAHSFNFLKMSDFLFKFYSNLLFPDYALSYIIVFISMAYLIFTNIIFKKINFSIISLFLFIPILGIFVNKTPSSAYLPIIFIPLFITIGLLLSKMTEIKLLNIISYLILLIIIVIGFYQTIFNKSVGDYQIRLRISKEIIDLAKGQKYTLKGIGAGSEFESFRMNYQYLTWWLGNEPQKNPKKIKFTISEEKGIKLKMN